MNKVIFFAILALLATIGIASAQQSVIVPATTASVPITITTATTTRLIVGVASKRIYVTAVDVIAAGTGNIQFISGTGTTCGTGTINVTGDYNLTAQVGFTKATGNGAVWVLGLGLSLCAVTSAGVGMPGSLSYAIF